MATLACCSDRRRIAGFAPRALRIMAATDFALQQLGHFPATATDQAAARVHEPLDSAEPSPRREKDPRHGGEKSIHSPLHDLLHRATGRQTQGIEFHANHGG